MRESAYLEYFRKWIQTEASSTPEKGLLEMKTEVEAKLKESQERVLLKYLNPKGSFTSWAQTMIGVGLDLCLPGTGAIADLIKQFGEEREKKQLRWQAFIIDTRNKFDKAF